MLSRLQQLRFSLGVIFKNFEGRGFRLMSFVRSETRCFCPEIRLLDCMDKTNFQCKVYNNSGKKNRRANSNKTKMSYTRLKLKCFRKKEKKNIILQNEYFSTPCCNKKMQQKLVNDDEISCN